MKSSILRLYVQCIREAEELAAGSGKITSCPGEKGCGTCFPLPNELFITLCNTYMERHMSVSDHSLSEGEKAEVLRLLKSHS